MTTTQENPRIAEIDAPDDVEETTPEKRGSSAAGSDQEQPAEAKEKKSLLTTWARAAGRAAGRLHVKARSDEEAESVKDNEKRTRRRRGDTPEAKETSLQLRATVENVAMTDTEVTAWFVMGQLSTAFSPMQRVNSVMASDALAYSKLIGRRFYLRTTSRPHSVFDWAERTWADAERNGSPIERRNDQRASASGMLMRDQHHLREANFSDKFVYLGVRVATYRRFPRDPQREVDELRAELTELQTVLAGSTLNAEPATAEDMEWLLRRSVSLGLPCPEIGLVQDYDDETVPLLESRARMTGEPFARTVKVTGDVIGEPEQVTRHVSVLTLARLGDQNIPENVASGWMQRTDSVAWPVEWSAVVDVQHLTRTNKWLIDQMNKIRDQMDHYISDHRQDPPELLKRQNELAKRVQGEIQGSNSGLEIRTEGWYRCAVAGETVEQANERAKEIEKLYGSNADFDRSVPQWHAAREFIPGEGLRNSAYSRMMSVRSLAGAIPHGTASIGDRDGIALGYTAGQALRAFSWNTHRDMERRDRSGLTVIAAGLGGGKSYAMGSIIYRDVMLGARWNVLDPSDRLGRLCDLPELKGRSRYINLMKGKAGELGPYRVVGDPKREHFDSQKEYETELSNARGNRRSLMRDILTSFVSPELLRSSDGITGSVITRALDAVPPERTSTATDVLTALADIEAKRIEPDLTDAHRIRAGDVLRELRQIAQTPIGRLIFPPEGEKITYEDFDADDASMLNVYTLNGIRIPREADIQSGEAKESERLSVAVVQLAAWLVQSRMYEGDRAERKGLGIDEGKTLSAISAGKTLITKSATDSRKFNVRALIASQDVTHFEIGTGNPDALDNLVGTCLIGNTEGEIAQRKALQLMGIPLDQGYEQILGSLIPPKDKRREKSDAEREQMTEAEKQKEAQEDRRHFIFFDGQNHERIVIDTDAHPHVKKALNSRPKGDIEDDGQTAEPTS